MLQPTCFKSKKNPRHADAYRFYTRHGNYMIGCTKLIRQVQEKQPRFTANLPQALNHFYGFSNNTTRTVSLC